MRVALILLLLSACEREVRYACDADRPCPAGRVCIDGQCVVPCSSTQQCGPLEACLEGRCQTYVAECDPTHDCADGWYCANDGACRRDQTIGTACDAPDACQRGACVDRICCDAPCTTPCHGCTAELTGDLDGVCAPVLVGRDPHDDCAGPLACDGSGACFPGTLGTTCEEGYECSSGECADDRCCEEACAGLCRECGADGTCAPVPFGADPDEECAGTAICNGLGACRALDCAPDLECSPTGSCESDCTTCSGNPFTCNDESCVATCADCTGSTKLCTTDETCVASCAFCSGAPWLDVDRCEASCWLREIGSVDDGETASSVFVVGQYAYMADMNDGLEIIDVSDPTQPVEIGQLDTLGQMADVFVAGDYAHLSGRGGYHVVDVSDPTQPTEVFGLNQSSNEGAVHVDGDRAYVTRDLAGVDIWDISTPTAPTLLGTFKAPSSYATDVYAVGNTAYLAYGQYGFVIVDVTDPAAPTEVTGSRVDNNYLLYGVTVAGDYAYVTDRNLGLLIIDIATPSSAVEVGNWDDGDWGMTVQVIGDYAFLANDWGGVEIIDVSNPAEPVELVDYTDGGRTNHLFISNQYIYVADGSDGLEILEDCIPR